jgi:cellulose synthase/poly-beta-1,6-N-acetylglucosamine synthase-like glycosyltransferase
VRAGWSGDPRVTLVNQPNGGKFRALNRAYTLIDTEVVIGIDADTIVRPDAIAMLARHFHDPKVGAVAGNVKVGNRGSLMARLQALEYVTAQNIDRRAAEVFNGMLVVPGAISAWRRAAVEQAGYYSSQTLAEDADLTIAIVRAGYRIIYEEAALGTTEAPETARHFLRQRLRWTLGMLQAAWKHRGAVAERRWIGLVSIPELLLFSVIMAVFAPIADITVAAVLLNAAIDRLANPASPWTPPALALLLGYCAFFLSDVMVGLLAFRLEPGEDRRLLLLLPLQRILYRQLQYVAAIRALSAALSGRLMVWQKITRAAELPAPVATPQPGDSPRPQARAARRQVLLTPRTTPETQKAEPAPRLPETRDS